VADQWVTAGSVAAARDKWIASVQALRSIEISAVAPLGGEIDAGIASSFDRAKTDESTLRAQYEDALRGFQEGQRGAEFKFARLVALGQLVLAIGMAALGYMQLMAAQEERAPIIINGQRCPGSVGR
jgi:hypothetical protein